MFGVTLSETLASLVDANRDLDLLEIFAGVGSITAAATNSGLNAKGFDKARVPGVTDSSIGALSEDIVTKSGFQQAVRLVGRLRAGGMLWLAPKCSSWVFYNVSRTKRGRQNQFRGDPSYGPVQEGNATAEACVFLIKLAKARGVDFAVENPKNSYIWHSVFFSEWLAWEELLYSYIHRCAFDAAPVGSRIMKVYQIVGSGSWLGQVGASCPCGNAVHKRLTISWRDAKGRLRVQGAANLLRESQAYPPAMGVHIVAKWRIGYTRPGRLSPETESPVSWQPKPTRVNTQWPRPQSSATWLNPAAQNSYPTQPGAKKASSSSQRGIDWALPAPCAGRRIANCSLLKKARRNESSSWQQPSAASAGWQLQASSI